SRAARRRRGSSAGTSTRAGVAPALAEPAAERAGPAARVSSRDAVAGVARAGVGGGGSAAVVGVAGAGGAAGGTADAAAGGVAGSAAGADAGGAARRRAASTWR